MKKLLALVLALVMTLSLATVSTNAAFADADEISYDEAANVLSAVGVFVGDGVNFNAKAALNREQAAKLVAYLALGEDVAEALPSVQMFDDVAASSWAAKYIAYCADAGIITGDGAGKFYPASPVDGYAFAKMLLCALGYKAEAEGYTGTNWSINVATDAKAAGLNAGFNGKLDKNLTREEAAQLMFNAIKAEYVVEYSALGNSVTIGDVVVNQNWGNPTMSYAYDGTVYYENQWDADNGELTFLGEQTDAFGRKANVWEFDGEEVSRAPKAAAAFVITEKMTAKEVASMFKGYKLGSYKVDLDTAFAAGGDATYNVNNDGALAFTTGANTAAEIAALTGNGVTVEIFVDGKNIEYVTAIDYTFAKVDDVTVDAKTGAVTYDLVKGDDESTSIGSYINNEDATQLVFDGTLAEGDFITFYEATGTKLYAYAVKSFEGALTKYTDDNVYTIAGDTYELAEVANAVTDLSLSDAAKYWVDQYGFVVKTDDIATTSTNYAYVLGYENDTDTVFNSTSAAVKVKAILSDGTVGIFDAKIAKKSSKYYMVDADGTPTVDVELVDGGAIAGLENTVFSYVLSGNTIALKKVDAPAGALSEGTYVDVLYENDYDAGAYVAKNDAKLTVNYNDGQDAVVVNSKTTFVFWNSEKETTTVITGSANLGDNKFEYAVNNDVVFSVSDAGKFTAKVVFVMDGWNKKAATTEKFGYVDFSEFGASKDGDDTVWTYTMTLVDGSKMALTSDTKLTGKGLYEYNSDATVGAELASARYIAGVVCESFADGVAAFENATAYAVSSDVKVIDLSDEYNTMEDATVYAYLDKDQKVIEVAYIFD